MRKRRAAHRATPEVFESEYQGDPKELGCLAEARKREAGTAVRRVFAVLLGCIRDSRLLGAKAASVFSAV